VHADPSHPRPRRRGPWDTRELGSARLPAEDIDADPGARGLGFRARQRAAQARGGAHAVRFRGRPEQLSGPSPTLNATPILTLQNQLSTPNLSWDFLALADPDRWDEYFAAGDLPRAEGDDLSVGDRRYGTVAALGRCRVPGDVSVGGYGGRRHPAAHRRGASPCSPRNSNGYDSAAKNRRVLAVAPSLIVIVSLGVAECVDEPVDNRWITCLCLGVT
jgi:hypothetical protein